MSRSHGGICVVRVDRLLSLLLCCGLEDLETVRELVAEGGAVKEGGIKR